MAAPVALPNPTEGFPEKLTGLLPSRYRVTTLMETTSDHGEVRGGQMCAPTGVPGNARDPGQGMYRLKYDPTVEAVHDALPQTASERLSGALATACDDPWSGSQPYGAVDDGIFRIAFADDRLWAVLFIHHTEKVITVLQINYLG